VGVQTTVDERLCEESERFAFRFTCEHCSHFAATESQCSLGYPLKAHHLIDLRSKQSVEFCKSFELG
jgi:hypothetical protein